MKQLIILVILFASAVAFAATPPLNVNRAEAMRQGRATGQIVDDEVDPRVRTYVWPKRLVWTTPQVGYRTRFRVANPEGMTPSSADL